MNDIFCPYCMAPVRPGESCPGCGLTAGNYVPSPHHLPPGTTLLDRYLVGRVLGEGGFGITYIGRDLRLDLKVAVKEYFPVDRATRNSSASLSVTSFIGPSSQSFERGKQKFLGEARTMARMEKQHVIVSVRDFFEVNNTAYIVMEYVEGITFRELVERKGGRIPPGELFETLEPLFHALSMMHESDLIHRDISPDNLMLENGRVRLLDFGCAREASRGNETLTITLKHGYAPMEQYQQKGQGPWTDIYALCATIYFCLTGQVPPRALDRIAEDELLVPTKLGVPLTGAQEAALLTGLRTLPHRRYQTVRELWAALYAPEPEPEPVPVEPVPVEPVPAGPGHAVPATEAPDPAADAEILSADEPAADGAVADEPEDGGAEEPEKPWLRKLGKKAWAAIGAAALALIALIIVLIPKGDGPGNLPADSETPAPGVTPGQSDAVLPAGPGTAHTQPPEADDPFAGAVRLEEGSEAALRELLEDDSVPAVTIPLGVDLELREAPVAVTKPLLIEGGAYVYCLQPITVDGGYLRVEGWLTTEGLVSTANGGSIAVERGYIYVNRTIFWLAHEDDLVIENGGIVRMDDNYDFSESDQRGLIFSEEAVREGATRVLNEDEFHAAADDPETTAIIIDADIEYFGYMPHHVPVIISEGVTVSCPIDYSAGIDGSWGVEGTVLINHGAFYGTIRTHPAEDEGVWSAVVNYGNMTAELDTCGNDANVINLGQMEILNGSITGGGGLYNLGTLRKTGNGVNGSHCEVLSDEFVNYGEMTVSLGAHGNYGEDSLGFANRVSFSNFGLLRILEGSGIDMGSYFLNAGEVVIEEGGRFVNRGVVETFGGTLVEHAQGGYEGGDGVHLYDPDIPPELASPLSSYGGMRFIPYVRGLEKGVVHVGSAEELFAALDDINCKTVVVEGGALLLKDLGNVIVGKGLVVPGELTLDGSSLTVYGGSGGFLLAQTLKLGDSSGLYVASGGAAVVDWLDDGYVRLLGGSLTIANLGYLNGDVDISQWSALVSLGSLHIRGAQIDVEQGSMICNGEMSVLGGNISIGEESGMYINCGMYVDDATGIENRGYLSMAGHGGFDKELAGSCVNRGEMGLGSSVQITGELINYGKVDLYNYGQDLEVGGSLENSGEIYAFDGVAIREAYGGSVFGNSARPAGE